MPIDSSIYQNVQAPQVNLPSPLQTAQTGIAMSQLGMRQQQMQQQQALRQAYAQNVGADGSIDQPGVITTLNKNGMGYMTPELSKTFAEQQKAQAEAQTASMIAMRNKMDVGLPKFEDLLSNTPEDQRPTVYTNYMANLKAQGIDFGSVLPAQYDEGAVKHFYAQSMAQKEQIDKQLTQATTGEAKAKTVEALSNADAPPKLKTAAEELGKFKDDVVNASSRKTTGALIDTRTRADRITSLLNSGAQPGETQAQRIQRLNRYMPQIGTEIGTSLAAIMQGGIPNEALQEKLSPDTISSNLAILQQKWKAEPTAANQGALLDAYGDVAKKLRDFSADQLGQITTRARAAYPFANKYYPKQMDQVGSQIGAPVGPGEAMSKGGDDQVASSAASAKPAAALDTAGALRWLKTADPSSPKAFQVRAALKARGLL